MPFLRRLEIEDMLSVIKQNEGPIITLRDGYNQTNVGTYLWQHRDFLREVEGMPSLE